MHQLDNMKYVRGDMNQTFSKELGNQCQCDGNCRCGYVQNNKLHCGNCGWNAPYSYNALTGNFVCPSCKTESCINPKKSNIDMNSNYIDPSGERPYTGESLTENSFTQGMVGLGMGNDGFFLWSPNSIGGKRKEESGFDQNTVAYAIGQQGMSMQPFSENPITASESGYDQNTVAYAIGQQGMSLEPFNSQYDGQESGLLGRNITGRPILSRDIFCGRYCKSLGYMRSADKNAFKKCKASCKINFKNAKKGAWKYPPAPEGVEESIDPEKLAKDTEKEVQSMSDTKVNSLSNEVANKDVADAQALRDDAKSEGGGKTMTWVIVGAIALILIAAIIFLVLRNKKAS